MRSLRLGSVCFAAALAACGGARTGADAPRAGCEPGVLPAGHWIGEWQTYQLSRPDNVRSGTLDVVVASGGKLTGSIVESDSPDLGTLTGVVRASGELSAESVVLRGGIERKYRVTGTFACEGRALAGAGTTTWGDADRAHLKFRLQRAD